MRLHAPIFEDLLVSKIPDKKGLYQEYIIKDKSFAGFVLCVCVCECGV